LQAPAASRSAKGKKKSVRLVADDRASGPTARFDASQALVSAAGGARGAGMVEAEGEPLIGRFLSKFNLWNRKDLQPERKAQVGANGYPSM
jgi:hypothetical protein